MVIAVLLGYRAAAVPGVAAALAGLIPAAALQTAATRQESFAARQARLAAAEAPFALEAVEVPAASAGGPGQGGVARYLRPEAEVVRFWPRRELADLLGGVAAGELVAVRLVTGPGGSGKTRVAR
jgi:hypothetical protein